MSSPACVPTRELGEKRLITFEPDSPWEVGQVVTFREEGRPIYHKLVVSVEHADDGSETQYKLIDPEKEIKHDPRMHDPRTSRRTDHKIRRIRGLNV
jgi:hypothetical protein